MRIKWIPACYLDGYKLHITESWLFHIICWNCSQGPSSQTPWSIPASKKFKEGGLPTFSRTMCEFNKQQQNLRELVITKISRANKCGFRTVRQLCLDFLSIKIEFTGWFFFFFSTGWFFNAPLHFVSTKKSYEKRRHIFILCFLTQT